MRSHETHLATPDQASPTVSERLAALDRVYAVVTRAGIPIAVAPPFAPDHEFSELDRAAINAAWFKSAAGDVGSDLTGEGVAAGYSDADKVAYATARFNSGGIVAGKTVEPYKWAPDGGMTLLEESIDRVRWDHLCFGGGFSGSYDEHKTQDDVKERGKARAAIRNAFQSVPGEMNKKPGFGGGKTYGELILAKSAEVLSARYAPKTRTKRAKSEDIGI